MLSLNPKAAFLIVAVPIAVLTALSPLAERAFTATWDDDAKGSPIPMGSRQLILVSAPSPDGFRATLTRFERTGSNQAWRAIASPEPVVLGPKGLGAGRGLHASELPLAPKQEGDGKSPAGVFTLGEAFGFEDRLAETLLRYRVLVESTECIDDASSAHYNQIVERGSEASVDWSSSEKMRAIPGYELGIVIEHNAERAKRGGSCIFFHVWSDPNSPTAGCTAMSRRAMVDLAECVDPRRQPVVAQLPESIVDDMADSWALPSRR